MRTRFLIFIGIVALAEFYSFVLVRSLTRSMSSGWKIGILSSYVLISIAVWLLFVLLRPNSNLEIPHAARNILIAFTIGFWVAKILIAAVMSLDDIRRLFIWIVSWFYTPTSTELEPSTGNGSGISRSEFFKKTALILGATTLGAFVYGITNRYNYKVHRIKLSFDNLPKAFKGMKIIQISDVHSGSFDSHAAVEKGVQKAMEEKPDVIFFTGDLVNNRADEIQPFTDIFSKLSAPLGVYSTLGNHDYGDYVEWPSQEAKTKNLDRLKQTHANMGWRLLMNEHVELERNGEKIAIVGIENWGAKAGFPKYGDMTQAYNGLPEKEIPFKILLSHDPSHWDAEVITKYKDIDLTLSGHTHGMQFGIEIPGLKWSPVKYVYKNWAGLYKKDKQHLYVNRGFGFLGYPGRLGILPEITVIELA